MLFEEKTTEDVILDTFTLVPLPKIVPLNYFEINGTKTNNIINDLKINDGDTYLAGYDTAGTKLTTPIETVISLKDAAISNYDMISGFDSLEHGSTIINAQLAGTLSAGNIPAMTDLQYISVLRLGPEDNYKNYHEIAIVNWIDDQTKYSTRDYLIDSHAVYFYSIRAVTKAQNYGRIYKTKEALNTYDYDWIISDPHTHFAILNSKISSITYNSKDGIIEPIGATYATVNRFSDLNYRSFTLTGTISSQTDIDGSLGIATRASQTIPAEIKDRIESIYNSKLGQSPENISNSMLVDLHQERLIREHAMDILNDGRPKLFKSPTEGLMFVKLSKIQVTPKDNLDRYVADFSAQVTEIGKVTEDVLDYFKIVDKNYYEDM